MTAILNALRWDVIVQARNGFYWASAFLIIVISALLLSVPESARANSALWVPAILVINLQITTFFFVAGLMLLERDEGMLNALAVSPLSPTGYLVMRTVSLTGLAAAETIAIVWIGFGTSGSWSLILGGTAALGVIYTGFGAAVATRYDSVNALLLPASAFVALLLLPLLPHFGLAPRLPFFVHPLEPPMTLIRAGYGASTEPTSHSGSSARSAGARSRLCGDETVSARSCTTRGPQEADERRHVSALIYADSRVLWRDPLLGWILALPIGLALLLRSLIPRVQEGLLAGMGFDLTPYHPLVMGGYLMTAPGMVGMVIGFLFLDERDARTLTALRTTPLSMRQYLAYRVALPLLLGTASTLIGYPLTGLTPLACRAVANRHRRWLLGADPGARARDRCAEQGRRIRGCKSDERGESPAGRGVLRPSSTAVRRRNLPDVLADARPLVGGGRRILRVYLVIGTVVSGLALLLAAWLFDRRLLRRA